MKVAVDHALEAAGLAAVHAGIGAAALEAQCLQLFGEVGLPKLGRVPHAVEAAQESRIAAASLRGELDVELPSGSCVKVGLLRVKDHHHLLLLFLPPLHPAPRPPPAAPKGPLVAVATAPGRAVQEEPNTQTKRRRRRRERLE